ncbi:hypothetical protein [Amycolatopsis eburnea]|uniref:Uncharacterized protein n=1 Tax=Amycolatopsis eburnea TaxID=2267691 RepID=A0A3R9EQS0_9PSEU|nr:hypothetical protein [Amycolatopsis eburnea]RSD17288.1 hypothetical protein EIY87_21190 [Amycolatopsis eburnea]
MRGTDDTAYLLEPAFLPGSEVSDATSGYDAQLGQWVVDSRVVSVMTVRIAVLDGMARISGKLTEQRAGELARQIEGD